MDCFGSYFTHVQNCDNVPVQSATQWTALVHTWHMSKPVITFVFKVVRSGLLRFILYTCPNLWWRSCSKCYAMDCCGSYFTHAQTCDNVRIQSGTQWTALVHTSHMSKPVITFVFKVVRSGLLRFILYTCPTLWLCSHHHVFFQYHHFRYLFNLRFKKPSSFTTPVLGLCNT